MPDGVSAADGTEGGMSEVAYEFWAGVGVTLTVELFVAAMLVWILS